MDKRRIDKLSKAAVAAVLGVSSVAVSMPQPAKAREFTDLDPNADYYKPVLDLANRGVINGYGDGTFRPHSLVTRGQAAKMLALALKLDTSNVSNPGFKDVQPGTELYPYIAALASKGIISGYSDGTFKPNQPITRGEVAKALAIGYHFEIASELNHDFTDVPNTNSYAYYIQTLVNLNITKGATPTEFRPFEPVTRGQMATFIVRSENADAVPVYKVGKIEGNKVYINSVPYTVDSSLTSIFNESNEAVLQGAIIEGNFDGGTLKYLTKLTITASGTDSKHLVFDGKNSTYNGQLIIQGNYLDFKNWTLNGTVILAENVAKKLGNKPFKNIQIASIQGFGFIDWNKQTEPENDETLNPVEDQDLKDKPTNSKKKDAPPMPSVEKYVDFTNCYLNRLVIEQNRTYVAAKNKINTVTVQGYVQQFELVANAETLYLQPENSVTMFGRADIKRLYNNSYYNVQFKSDSYVDELIIDNGSGWVDLDEHFYVGKVILPKGKYPRDIFDDYENDKGRLPNVEDEEGNKVIDPIDDIIIPDRTPPEITAPLSVTADSTTAMASFTANEKGHYYYIVQERGTGTEPSIRDLLTKGVQGETNEADQKTYFTIDNLKEQTEYEIYLVVIDLAGNASYKEYETFITTDGTPPVVTEISATPLHGGKRVELNFRASEPGEYYYFYREKLPTEVPDPSTQYILTHHQGSGKVESPNEVISHIIEGLKAETEYEIYVVLKDKSGIYSVDPAKKTIVTTTELDDINPYVTGPDYNRIQQLIPTGINEFYVYFNEELDKETAEDINNYDLSGTGIINVTGQQVIKPSKAEYTFDQNGSRVKLTVPSFTGFVHGDTLRVTVLPGVKDLAGNEFENSATTGDPNVTPRNYADYRHSDLMAPTLTIDNVNRGPDKVEVEFNTNKAGTYYYMIMPDPEFLDIDLSDIIPRDFIDEFSSDATKRTGKFQDNKGRDIYVYKDGTIPAMLGKQKFDIEVPENLDPFKSYSVYMVLRDRSGNLSEIVHKQIISDSKPPLIQNYDVTSYLNDDTKAILTIQSNEKGTAHILAVKKYVTDENGNKVLNPVIKYSTDGKLLPLPNTYENGFSNIDRKNAFNSYGSVTSATMTDNAPNEIIIGNLSRHEEYVFYIGVEDTYGNFTVQAMSPNSTDYINEPSGDYMIQELYTDGTLPEIDPVIEKLTEYKYKQLLPTADTTNFKYGNTFAITFSEAISFTGDPNPTVPLSYNEQAVLEELKNSIQSTLLPGTTITDIRWQSIQGLQTYQPRKLIFTVSTPNYNNEIEIDMDSAAFSKFVDLANQSFNDDKSKGYYKIPENIHKINSAILQPDATHDGLYASTRLNAYAEFNIQISWKPKYYYAVVTSGSTLNDEKEIQELIRRADLGLSVADGLPTVMIYGTGNILDGSGKSIELPLVVNPSGTGGLNQPVNIFQKDQRIYIFTMDQYGNIVFATDSNGNNFVEIKPYGTTP